jgi:dihydrofolate reductase
MGSLKRSLMTQKRKIIVQIATSADGYIARPDGDIEWLSKRPHPKDTYGMAKFVRSIDTIVYGRKTYDFGVQMGAKFDKKIRNYVFSSQPSPSSVPGSVEFVNEPIRAFAKRLRGTKGKNIWMMGGAAIIASFLDATLIGIDTNRWALTDRRSPSRSAATTARLMCAGLAGSPALPAAAQASISRHTWAVSSGSTAPPAPSTRIDRYCSDGTINATPSSAPVSRWRTSIARARVVVRIEVMVR